MINWRKPIECPKPGSKIIALSWGWKEAWPGSLEIIGGEVEYPGNSVTEWRCNTCDDSGAGNYSWYSHSDYDTEIDAWCYAEDAMELMPSFMSVESSKEARKL